MKIKFKRDTSFRKNFFTPESFAHPAKMDSQLLLWIVNKYTKVGETILDPMAGSGTAMLACTMGRNVVLVELEDKFCKMMRDNWEIVRMMPQLGFSMGDCQIIQGDARSLEGIVDKIVTSPPYASTDACQDYSYASPVQRGTQKTWNSKTGSEKPDNPSNIGNLRYGEIDAVIGSPPYEGALTSSSQHGNTGIAADNPKLADTGRYKAENQDNIGNLKSDSYLSAMLQVYQQCHSVLKDSGLLILVTKNFIRNKQVVRLDLDTTRLCEQAGFSFIVRHYRKLRAKSF